MIGGPPPKPTAIRILEGNPSRRPLPENEPQPDAVIPKRPKTLSKDATREWRRLGPILLRMGVLTEADGDALAQLCDDIAEERRVSENLKTSGMIVKQNGWVQINPLFNLQATLRKRISDGFREFGLTPASRTRIQTTPTARYKKGDELLNGNWKQSCA